MIDFHSHILPGLDDGAITINDSIFMAKALSAFGYKTVCCTPHCIKGCYELSPQRVKEATLMLQADLDNADIHLELWPGTEYSLDEYLPDYADNFLPLGPTKLVLCEAPQEASHKCVQAGLELIIRKGFIPLVAHPERSKYFYERLTRLNVVLGTKNEENYKKTKNFFRKVWPFASRTSQSLHQELQVPFTDVPCPEFPELCLFLANLGSFTGYYGPDVQSLAYELLKNGIYVGMASNLHDGDSANIILERDKLAFNPLLKKIADWDGKIVGPLKNNPDERSEQCELF